MNRIEGNTEIAMLGVDGEWRTIPLAEALKKTRDGELYECVLCESNGAYGDGMRTFHRTSAT